MLGIAIAITAEAFRNKKDKGNQPYILHCLRVMDKVEGDVSKQAAVMHDLIEDTDYTLGKLLALGFSEEVLNIVNFLTHKKEDSYEDYIRLVSYNSKAKKIKMADLEDNSDITRLKGLREKDIKRMIKYHKAYTYLKNN